MNPTKRALTLITICCFVWFGVLWLMFHPVHYGAAASPGALRAGYSTAWIECDPEGCQTDLVSEGQEPIERFCSIIAIETPSDACNILGTLNLYRRLTWLVYEFPSHKASTPAYPSRTQPQSGSINGT